MRSKSKRCSSGLPSILPSHNLRSSSINPGLRLKPRQATCTACTGRPSASQSQLATPDKPQFASPSYLDSYKTSAPFSIGLASSNPLFPESQSFINFKLCGGSASSSTPAPQGVLKSLRHAEWLHGYQPPQHPPGQRRQSRHQDRTT